MGRCTMYGILLRYETTMKIMQEMSLLDFEFWGDAKVNAETLSLHDLEKVEAELALRWPYGISDVELNELFADDFQLIMDITHL